MFARKPKASGNSKREVSRCYFDVDNVLMYIDYSDILDAITEDTSLEDVLRIYDERHGTDFGPNLGDNALALYRNRLDQLPDWTMKGIEVRSWSEALAVEASAPRVYIERNGRVMELFLDIRTGDAKRDVRRYDSDNGTDFARHIEAGEARIVGKPGNDIAFPVESWDDVLRVSRRRRRWHPESRTNARYAIQTP